MLGRFDFSWDGINPPKMLEYNADTPSLLLESGDVSERWFTDKYFYSQKESHQSNYISNAMAFGFTKLRNKEQCGKNGRIGLVSFDDDEESYGQMMYMQKILDRSTKNSKVDDMSTLRLFY